MPDKEPLIYRQSFVVRSYDVDFRKNLRPEVLCGYFQEVASQHALRLGVGYQQLGRQGMFWVLSRLLFQVEQMPQWHEEITIETWARGTERLFARRDFRVRDAMGRILCSASSYWLILQRDTSRPVRPDTLFSRLKHEERAIESSPNKLQLADQQHENYRLTTCATDLDHNRHVNNLRYVAWPFNGFDVNYLEKYQLQQMQINFLAEVREGEEIAICREAVEDQVFLVSGYRLAYDAEACFSARLVWKKL